MAEHVAAIEEIKKLPEGTHIFCPRLTDDGNEASSEEESKQRRDQFFSALPLLAYDGQECIPFHKWLYETLDAQLSKCEACIRRYHLGKVDFKQQLLQEYEEDEVQQFLEIILRRDVDRIRKGLDAATRILEPLPPEQRKPAVLQNSQLFAFYEALHCDGFYNDENELANHFDTPFRLVQTHKELKIKEILPAITKFLFSTNSNRLDWAVQTWRRLDRDVNDEEWDWAIKDILSKELNAITDDHGLRRFWSGLRVIMQKLTPDQIKLKLFDMGFNFSRLSLDHLAKKATPIDQIAASLNTLWSKAPDAYWQALPSVSAATVAEQFFASPGFDRCLEAQADPETKTDIDVLSWTDAFLKGLQPANRPPAARTLSYQLFTRVKSDKVSVAVKQLCFESAVRCLLETILSFSEDESARKSAARPVLTDALGLVASHLPAMLDPLVQMPEARQPAVRANIVALVRNSLALECQVLKYDYEKLSLGTPEAPNSSYTPDLWRIVNQHLNPEHTDLSMALLKGTMDLLGLEQLPVKHEIPCKAEKESFNTMFGKVEDLVSQCVDHLAEFPVGHLDILFASQDTNMALMALLFSGNDKIYQATVEMIKNIAQEPGRVEALTHVIDAFFSNSLYSICWVFRRLTTYMPFKPIPRLLKTGKDIMDLLCDATGLLRTRKIDQRERHSVQAYWQYSWQILTTIFRRMEKWSVDVGDKPLMTEVCRNTMQYAQELFNHYYVFVNVLSSGKSMEEAAGIPKALLNTDMSSSNGSPPKALGSMVKWLRLRDPYLAETLVNLIIEMLKRLKEYGAHVSSDSYALTFVEEVAVVGSKGKGTRTVLSDNQKAGLIRALEEYTGKQIARPVQAQPKKQQRLDLESWSGKNKIKQEAIVLDDDDVKQEIKEEKDDLAIAEKLRREALLADRKAGQIQQQKKLSIPTKPLGPSKEDIRQRQQANSKAFIEQRKKEAAAAKARQAEMAARLRGKTGSEHTANAGSGLAGLGVQGKDHSIARSDLMVSSESESESNSDEELFGSSRPSSGAATPIMRGGPRGLIPTKKIKQVRSAKDMRARLSPDLTNLHKTILAWDFFADTDTPPNSEKDDYTLITNTFKTVQDYQRTFEPLLVLEGWQGFRQAREDGTFKPFEVKVANSLIVDNFFEVNSTIPMSEGKELGLSPSDIILLSKGSRPHVEPNEPHCLARVKEVTRKRGEVQIVYRVNSANNPMRSHLHDKATVYAAVITNLTPLEREYGALMALPYYDLVEEIIRAKPSPLLDYTDEEVEDIKQLHNLNTAQAKAVRSAVDNDAFTLIQGPPGSGKTKTITAILSAIITGMFGPARVNGNIGPPPSNKKILVAAPSNAAVDELVMRFKHGIKASSGRTEKINVVRLGRSEAINAAVKDVTLEELVNARLDENMGSNGKGKDDIYAAMMEHKATSEQMNEVRARMDEVRQKGQQVSDADDQLFESLKRKKTALSAQIDQMREKQNRETRDADINRRRIEQEILDSAHVLCATLSGSGHEKIQGLNVEFETVIIDEAAQSVELSALIPLKYGCSKCILVGDPKQLPPTVLSRQAAKYQYEQSLFARIETNHENDVHLLDTQYRMHPEISVFPSKTFYDSRLRDGGDMARLRARPWHRSQIFGPYRFFDVEGMHKSAPKGRSLVNEAEIDVALTMYDRLVTDVPKYDFRSKIGIITPYKGQLKALKERFRMRYGEAILDRIDFNTTDAFQGRESEIIIFSCVRASTRGIGFLNDVRRMNVGLTRAKCSLWILGNSNALAQGEFWRALVDDSKRRNLYQDGDILRLFDRPLLTADMMKDDTEMGGMDDFSYDAVPSAADSFPDPARHREGTITPIPNAAGPDIKNGESRPSSPKAPLSACTTQNATPTAGSSGRSTAVTLGPPSRTLSSSSSPKVVGANDKPISIEATSNQVQIDQSDGPDFLKNGLKTEKRHNPSGGKFGLNNKGNCAICGSDQHFSNSCDNAKAREAHLGECRRCGGVGHSRNSCSAPRCFACGNFGHQEVQCRVDGSKRLISEERRETLKQEERHQQHLREQKVKQAKKQLGEHGASIPAVKTNDGNSGKRKREDGQVGIGGSKASKTTSPAPPYAPTGLRIPNVGMGAAGQPRPSGPPLVRKKRDDANAMFAKKR